MSDKQEKKGKERTEDLVLEPREALDRLIEGNRRFMEDRSEHPRRDAAQRAMLRKGQRPFAAIVGCADSRVPAELIFDQGLGDLFMVRVAGNVAAPVVIGSIEYAVAILGVKIVAVLGHEGCGAVQTALEDGPVTDSIQIIMNEIRPVVAEVGKTATDVLDAVVRANIINVSKALVSRSDTIRSRVERGDLLIVPLLYEFENGHVEQLHASTS